jgi:hypothetical protein
LFSRFPQRRRLRKSTPLSKNLEAYKKYSFKFISISKDASDLRKQTYSINPHELEFTPQEDILDIKLLLNKISSLDIDHQRSVFSLVKKELGKNTDISKISSNLTSVINILAAEDFTPSASDTSPAFKIEEKIKYNDLNSAETVVSDYAVNATRVGQIYKEFDKSGVNKSFSVLNSIRQMYLRKKSELSADALFFEVIDEVIERVRNSSNFKNMPLEELEQAVNILVVDAFIRCKIFENPMKVKNATP